MSTRQTVLAGLVTLVTLAAGPDRAPAAEGPPDPASVRRYGPAYRYPQAGWIVLHIEGEPYDRGYQHGWLMADELAASVRCGAALRSARTPADGWKSLRTLVNALFLRAYDREYLEEMKGIADGASAAGARFEGRPLDLVDVVAVNAWPEVETLDPALEATATGLEPVRFRHQRPDAPVQERPMHCSAFAATGPATADGKVVIGHITMFSLYPSSFYNVWLDVKPAKGHRVLMQTYPGGIQSGLDYYLNDNGLVVVETTIGQTKFDKQGLSVASRIRKALQYADGIDGAVEILSTANNGLYSNEWLLADTRTNEIAMFELGTARSKLWRSSKNQWYGGTEGFYWGCNNAKDMDVRLETVANVEGRPANVAWVPSGRDRVWLNLFQRHKGTIDETFGKLAFTTAPIAAYHSVDAKFTTTALAKDLKTWALFGPPLGRTWHPTIEERKAFPEVRPLVSNPWTVLTADAPARPTDHLLAAVDLGEPADPARPASTTGHDHDRPLPTVPAWHGTLLPKTPSDIWLTAAFSQYEKYVAEEHALRRARRDGQLSAEDRTRLALALFARRAEYTVGSRAWKDEPLGSITSSLEHSHWYRVAFGKGVLALHELRTLLTPDRFDPLMDEFGRAHAGRTVTTAEFREFVERGAGKTAAKAVGPFFDGWLKTPGLPTLQMSAVVERSADHGFVVRGLIHQDGAAQMTVEVALETAGGEELKTLILGPEQPPDRNAARDDAPPVTHFEFKTRARPVRLVADKYGSSAKKNGGGYAVQSFMAEQDDCLIVYGTADDAAGQHETALTFQHAIRAEGSNRTVAVRSDREVTDAELASHHVVLIGRPDSNRVAGRFRATFPVRFGPRSFVVNGETYAHSLSGVVAAGENPLNPRFSAVVLAGLSAEATTFLPEILLKKGQQVAEVLIAPHGKKARGVLVPARDLSIELTDPKTLTSER